MGLKTSIEEGHYAKKQIGSKDWLISWSHSRRYQMALTLAARFAGKKILDYGCGDGTFLGLLMQEPTPPAQAVGGEINSELANDCAKRLGQIEHLSFIVIDELQKPAHSATFDGIICMDVLEHVLDVNPIIDLFGKLLKSEGILIISVPVETGLPFIVKQAVRNIAGWRGIGDYPGIQPYTFNEYLTSIFAGSKPHIERPILKREDGSLFHDHKGFNWKALQQLVSKQFNLEKVLSSPLTWLPPQLGSQAWFILRKP